MISCDPSALANAAVCFSQCISDPLQVRTYLLCQYVNACRAPLAPTNLALSAGANNPGSSTITVQWNQPLQIGGPTITGYLVKWGTASGNYNVGQAIIPAAPLSYTITGLNSTTTYFIVVEALATSCPSANSNELSATTTGSSASLPQQALLVLQLESSDFDGSANGSNITTWNDKSGAGHNFNLTGAALNGNPAVPTVDGVNTLNGHKTIRFNNSSIIGINGFNFAAAPGVEMICVYKTDLPVVGNGVFFCLMRTAQNLVTATPFTDNNFYEAFGRTDRPNIGQPVSSLANFVCYDVSSLSNNSAYNAWINTENFFSSAVYTFSNIQQASFSTLGGGFNGVANLFGSGNIAAVYAWNTPLSATDRAQARAYVKQTWGNGFGF